MTKMIKTMMRIVVNKTMPRMTKNRIGLRSKHKLRRLDMHRKDQEWVSNPKAKAILSNKIHHRKLTKTAAIKTHR